MFARRPRGRHHLAPARRRFGLLGPLAGLAVAATTIAGGTLALTSQDGKTQIETAPGAAAAPSTTGSGSGQPPGGATPSPTDSSRTGERASRDGARTVSPSPTRRSTVVLRGTCEASYYGDPQPTASGETFDPQAMTAAHKSWDFGTRVRVSNLTNGKSVIVRINDRGPYIDGRCLDLSEAAFAKIANLAAGVADVRYEVLAD